jgi:hypothetical protein
MSAEQMKTYFHNMSKGKIDPADMYIINQKGRGLGPARRGKVMYRIPNNMKGSGGRFISPVQQSIDQAKKMVGIKRKKPQKKRQSVKSGRVTKTSTATARKKKKKVKKPVKKTKKKKTSSKKKKVKDIFS